MGVTPIYSIPFAEPSDLVRDWPELSEDVADAVEAAIVGIPVLAGIGSNVVTASQTGIQTLSMSAGAVSALTNLSVAITPSSDTARVLIIGRVVVGGGRSANDSSFGLILKRGGTAIGLGATDGSRTSVTASVLSSGDYGTSTGTFAVLDSPGVATAVTYSIDGVNGYPGSLTWYVNRAVNDNNNSGSVRAASSLTVIEVAP